MLYELSHVYISRGLLFSSLQTTYAWKLFLRHTRSVHAYIKGIIGGSPFLIVSFEFLVFDFLKTQASVIITFTYVLIAAFERFSNLKTEIAFRLNRISCCVIRS